ncbi:MAG: ATP-binding cassette domain-containing protein [Deltaproteobacteria bacterium]|nr:ATP-binding cassette domain-containing protein [Candidatus Zymogenaceae bacterium]
MIRLSDVSISYGSDQDNPSFALMGVNLDVPEGTYAVLIGPNGSGKTTLAKIIKGIVAPTGGTVTVAGKNLGPEEISEDVGLVFSNPENQIISTVVEEDIAFGLENRGIGAAEMRRRVNRIIKRLGLTQLAKRLPHTLSGGEQQRLVIAGILVMETKIIVLDEATSMLDANGKADILRLIRELNEKEGITVLSITHSLVEAVLSDIVFVLDRGKIVFSGTPGQFINNDEILARLDIELPEFLLVLKGLMRAGIDIPDTALGVQDVIGSLDRLRREG